VTFLAFNFIKLYKIYKKGAMYNSASII
jgi:hypothetical protein